MASCRSMALVLETPGSPAVILTLCLLAETILSLLRTYLFLRVLAIREELVKSKPAGNGFWQNGSFARF